MEQVQERLSSAAARLFRADPRLRSVGITRAGAGFGFRAVRNAALPVAQGCTPLPAGIEGIPVFVRDSFAEVRPLLLVPGSGPASPLAGSTVPEVRRHRHLGCGVQVQNVDDDEREGVLAAGLMQVGSLGCFVQLADGSPALLSNNHVIAGENRGVRGVDRIQQPGGAAHRPRDRVGRLADFEPLAFSTPGAHPFDGTAALNVMDAAVAVLDDGIPWRPGFLPVRNLPTPTSIARPCLGDAVCKVGRTTGLTYGEVTDVDVTVGPIRYGSGACWFSGVFAVEGEKGASFSDGGDSGAIILRPNGEVVGLLFAGNGEQTFACPIHPVLDRFGCTLAPAA